MTTALIVVGVGMFISGYCFGRVHALFRVMNGREP